MPTDPSEIVERYFTVVKSLNECDKAEIRGVERIRRPFAPAT